MKATKSGIRKDKIAMPTIDIHADDYALTVGTSRDMLVCMENGQLDSISIVPNMSCFQECEELLCHAIPTMPFLPKMSVHLNFVEGRSLVGTKHVPMLTQNGSALMGLSWSELFLLSYLPWKRGVVKRQLKKEIEAQIEIVQSTISRAMDVAKEHGIPYGQTKIRIDSHEHTHMIPVVWEALIEVIEEKHYDVEYIRNPKEVLGAFISEVSLWKTYRPINFVKNILLSFYSHKVDSYGKMHGMVSMYVWGLVMSGYMDYDRIVKLYPKITAKADKANRVLEMIFHPGQMLPEEVSEEIDEKAAKAFCLRNDRHVEKDTVSRIRTLVERG